MSANRGSNAYWLGAAGASVSDAESSIGDAPVDAEHDAFEEPLQRRASMDRFVDSGMMLGSLTETYRVLAASAELRASPVAPRIIGECIAGYRLLLGRDPDVEGFRTFSDRRSALRLVDVLEPIAGSAEAVANFAPFPTPAVQDVALAVTATSIQIVHAAVADAALGLQIRARGRFDRLEQKMDDLHRHLDRIEGLVEQLSRYVELRGDAQAAES